MPEPPEDGAPAGRAEEVRGPGGLDAGAAPEGAIGPTAGVSVTPTVADAAPSAGPEAQHDPAVTDGPAAGAATGPEAAADGATDTAVPDPALFAHALRLAEALVFASDRPVTPQRLQGALPPGMEARAVLTALAAGCADRPVQLVEVAGGFAFRTAPELAPALTRVVEVPRRLPRAAMETLAIIAYHQPVTRAEVEEIRGASLSQATLETLLEMGLIAPRGRKEVPGRPSLWATTPRFLEQFGLRALTDLPRREELVNEPGSPLLAPAPPNAG
ncbi:SMC-Scp complex subunit ScpB [Roseicella aquatilis]|uniref:SMC-Scp complex subunit ScpB n=1 Tax=Roseicella aquatilis TaxID=2527868 RepID=A0A4R4DWE2_9PROT|nr:SMC-Scp complex subunit ScpB [Roseicella aquatilis]